MPRLPPLVSFSPPAILVLVAAVDMSFGPSRVVLGLLAIVPMAAANILGRRATAAYAVAALVVAAALGVFDEQYSTGTWPVQAVRLVGIAAAGLLAVWGCSARLHREARMRELVAEAARARAQAEKSELIAGLAESLQRSLLTDPPQLDDLEITARYVPAAEHLKIGGDWYDAFPAPGGRTMLVIGDVAGHGQPAAAAMAQVRHTLRGITQLLELSPAAVLEALDAALTNLDARVLATVVLAQITRTRSDSRPGLAVRWANAGHPPVVLARADGRAELLERDPDPVLGIGFAGSRRDHQVTMDDGDSLIMFTDGLVEQRRRCIDEGLERVRATCAATAHQPLEKMCDTVMAHPHHAGDDDIALIGVRAQLTRRGTGR